MYNLILVIIDRLIKYKHFILYKEASNAIKLMYTFLKVIIINYRLLEEIILDSVMERFSDRQWKQ